MNNVKETPPWLKEEHIPLSEAGGNNVGNYSSGVDNAETEVPRMILFTRLINLALSILMSLVALLSLLTTQSATTGVLACYVVAFSCLLCCFETHLKQMSQLIAVNFGFLYSGYSRAAFLFFVSTILFSLSLFGKLIGLLMMANALFNVAILIKYPGFDQAQRSDAQNEIQDFLSQHPSYAQSMINVGVNLMTSNNNNNRSAPPSSASQGRPVSTRNVGGQPYETIIRV